jgi:uncharacterized protein (DUF2141 family)
MMNRSILLFLLLNLTALFAKGQHALIIEINHLHNSEGQVLLELQDEMKNVVKGLTGTIRNNSCLLTVDSLSTGTYAFKYFHDENKNNKLDTNVVGIPKEGYGFSNDAIGRFGPPAHEKMIFEFKKDTTIQCTPYYIFN